jgi:protoporphyrinogen oxidase
VIDKRVKADNLLSLFMGMLLPKPVETSFYYPSKGGIQTFCDVQAERIRKSGGRILLNSPATGLEISSGKVTGISLQNGETIPADRVFWTAPLTILYPETNLEFMSTLVANVALKKINPVNDYQWCYFGQEDILFSRLTVPRHFRSDCVPQGKDSVIAEITCPPDSLIWRNPEVLNEKLSEDLKRVGASSGDDILFIDWQRIPETYPVYTLDYREKLSSIALPEGLVLAGRSGSFWYNNMDHSIAQALSIISGTEYNRDFWNRS